MDKEMLELGTAASWRLQRHIRKKTLAKCLTLWLTLVGYRRQERKTEATVEVKLSLTWRKPGWHNHQSIPLKSIITTPPLITTLPHIIIIRLSITTRAESTRTPSITRLRLTSIANKLTSIRRQHIRILRNRPFPVTAPQKFGAFSSRDQRKIASVVKGRSTETEGLIAYA